MSRTVRRTAAGGLALGLLTLAGCASEGAPEVSPTVSAEGAGGLPVLSAGAGHVHGLAVNPADGLVYLGTHTGALVVDGDTIRRVGDTANDLMGFAVAGPDHFYASGHPGPGSTLPEPVGLIESTDGGETWEPLSLGGQADFHTMAASGEQVYGYAGELLASEDGRTWTPGADVAPASLAVDPSDGSRVVATTEQGPLRSDDGGETFEPLADAPLLLFVAWPAADALWGVSPEGTVHVSADAGATWAERADVDPPIAFTAGEDGSVVVGTESAILRSDDGSSFEPIAEIAGH